MPTTATPIVIRRRLLRVIREERGFSQDALAKRAGTHQPVIAVAEKRGRADILVLARLAGALSFTGNPRLLLDMVEFTATVSVPRAPHAALRRGALGQFMSLRETKRLETEEKLLAAARVLAPDILPPDTRGEEQ